MASPKLLDALAATAEVCGSREFSRGAAALIVEELRQYPEYAVLKALERCRRELRSLTLADIVARIDDGRPGAEEAWAMLPRGEEESVVWTPEIAEAHAACSSLMDEDPVAARMAFKETYTRLLAQARAEHRPVTWNVSLGHDASRREGALREAVEKNRVSVAEVQALLPDFSAAAPKALLTGPDTPVASNIRQLAELVSKAIPRAEPSEVEIQDRARRARAVIERLKGDGQ